MEQNFQIQTVQKTGKLQLSPISLNPDYRKKWQITGNDFVCLTRDGDLVNNSLFRVGGLGTNNISDKKYFILIKYNEDFYDNNIMKHSKNKIKEYLSGHSCILNDKGEIKFEADSYEHPYLVGGCIYVYKKGYYNIETGYCYADSVHSTVTSDDYIFLENHYDKDLTKRGVIKINKYTGEFEIFKKTL